MNGSGFDRRTMIAAAVAFMPLSIAAAPLTPPVPVLPTEHPLVAFVIDVSGNDAKLVASARKLIARPPGTFDKDDRSDPIARAWILVVQQLNEAGYAHIFEDKYVNEAFAIWIDKGYIRPAEMPEPEAALMMAAAQRDIGDDAKAQLAFGKRLFAGYAAMVAAIDAQFAARGKMLVSLDIPSVETLAFLVLDAAVAKRWIGTSFGTARTYYGETVTGISPPRWDEFWEALEYALSSSDESIGEFEDSPPELPPSKPLVGSNL